LLGIVLALFLFLLSQPANSAQIPVHISAERVEGDVNSVIRAYGRVVATYEEVVVEGDNALYNRKEGILELWGNVKISEGESKLYCDRVVYNLKTKRAVFENVEGYISKSDRIRAERIERINEKEWIAYNGEYTPCSGECPDWSVSAKRFRILVGESFAGKWVSFKVKGIPVLFSPVLSGPITEGRKSGFLVPRLGYISGDGLVFKQPFFLVLGRSADLTLTYEKRTIDGEGGEAQLRYILSRYSKGEVNYYQLNKKDKKNWKLNLSHTLNPSDYLYGSLKSELVSSREYYKSSSNLDTIEQSRVYTKSDITLSKLWTHSIINVNAVYLRYLDGSADDIYQKLPSVSFYTLDRQIFNSPLFFNLYSKATYFYRKAGGSSYRINLTPSLKLVHPLSDLKGTAELSYLYTYYQIGGERGLWKFKDTVRFNKFFTFKGYGLSVNPEISFTYLENKNQEELPFYDITDRISGEKKFSLSNEVYLYSGGGRLGRLSGGIDYLVDEGKWDSFKGDVEISPTSNFLLRESFSYSAQERKLLYSNTYVSSKLSSLSLWLNHYLSPAEEIRYLKWGFSLPFLRYLILNYSQRYDLKRSTDRERSYTLKINRGCWQGKITYRWIKNFDNTIDYQILLMVELVKLGSFEYSITRKAE